MTENPTSPVDVPELGEEVLVETDNSERPEDGEQDVSQDPAPDPQGGAPRERQVGGPVASSADVLHHAATEIGTVEGPNNATEYAAEAGHAPHQPWCATFIVAMFRRPACGCRSRAPTPRRCTRGSTARAAASAAPSRARSPSCTSPAWAGSPTWGSLSPSAATGAS